MSNLATAIVSMIGTAMWLGAGAYYKSNASLKNYTCGFGSFKFPGHAINMQGLCGELEYVTWVLIFMGPLELFSSATVGWAIWAAKKKRGAYARV